MIDLHRRAVVSVGCGAVAKGRPWCGSRLGTPMSYRWLDGGVLVVQQQSMSGLVNRTLSFGAILSSTKRSVLR